MTTKKVTRLPSAPPEPTLKNPHAQLDWLCERYVQRYNSESSKDNIRTLVASYKKFLSQEYGYDERLARDPRYHLSIHCDQFILYNAEQYWRSQKVASHTLSNWLRNLRKLVEFAASLHLTPTEVFLIPYLGRPKRETLQREAYDDADLELIWKTFRPQIEYANKVAQGYKPTGLGEDPRIITSSSNNSDPEADCQPGERVKWLNWGNFVWYFENVLHCQPFRNYDQQDKAARSFYYAAVRRYGKLEEVWRRLGVAPIIDNDLMLPLAMKLAWETGLNTESLLSLERDCYCEAHPLTGLPYLRYYKERSTGEKELHLSLLDAPVNSELTLLPKQSIVVKRTIDLIKNLTCHLVDRAKEEDKNLLFIYEPKYGEGSGKVLSLHPVNICRWTKRHIGRWKAEGYERLPECVNLSRFRPTKITQMVREGRDIFDIQAVAGHARVSTTINYLAERQITPQAKKEVAATLQRIHENRNEFERLPKPYSMEGPRARQGVIYKGVLCDCKNVYDPPKSVRQLPIYKEGQPCTYFNMCLFCPNAIITRKHLPLLVNYKREIELSIGSNNLMNAPHAAFYEKTLAVLDGIFLEYSQEEIAWAQSIAECADNLLDPVTYRGAMYEE